MEETSYYKSIGEKLGAIRKNKGITLAELADALGKSIATLSKYESGDIAISCDMLVTLCALYGVDVAEVLPAADVAKKTDSSEYSPLFVDTLWVYWCKGAYEEIHTSVLQCDNAHMTATMYFDVRDLDRPENADFTYTGRLSYSAYSVDFCLKNVNAPFDIVTLNFQSIPQQTGDYRYMTGLLGALTFFYQNIAAKAIASRVRIDDREELVRILKLTQNEFVTLKATNFFTVG